jgi:hypothetical protein
MLTFLAFLGKAAWPLIGSLVPWGGAKFGGIIGALLLALVVIGFPAGWAYHKGSEGKSAAVARSEAACAVKIADIQTAAKRTILDIVTSVDEEGTRSTDVSDYCKRNPALCRGVK